MSLLNAFFLPSKDDIRCVKSNLIVIVSCILTRYIHTLSPLSKSVQKHILHKYSNQISRKSEVVVLNVLMKNETKHSDMIDIMSTMQGYLGKEYPHECRVASGGDQLTYERQIGAQWHVVDGNTPEEQLRLLQPQSEDWHCLVCMLTVSPLQVLS